MPKTYQKDSPRKIYNDKRDLLPFITAADGIAYGEKKVEENRAAQLSFEEEVNKRVEEELFKRGLTEPSQMGSLNFTELASRLYGTGEASDDTMPQITEDSRDVSPSHNSKENGEITQDQAAAIADKKQGQNQKKDSRTLDSQERDSKEKIRGEIETGVREIAKEIPNGEKAVIQENINREAVQDMHSDSRSTKSQDRGTVQRSSKAKIQATQLKKDGQNKENTNPSKPKIEQRIVAKEITTIRANDYEGHDVKKETEKVKPKLIDISKGNLSANLARGQEDAKANNLLMAAVNLTSQTGRATEFLQGNDKLQMRRDPTDGCTYAYINDKKVGGDQAKDFIVKMNRELGPAKAEQLSALVTLAKNNPNLDKNIGNEHKQSKSRDVGDRG